MEVPRTLCARVLASTRPGGAGLGVPLRMCSRGQNLLQASVRVTVTSHVFTGSQGPRCCAVPHPLCPPRASEATLCGAPPELPSSVGSRLRQPGGGCVCPCLCLSHSKVVGSGHCGRGLTSESLGRGMPPRTPGLPGLPTTPGPVSASGCSAFSPFLCTCPCGRGSWGTGVGLVPLLLDKCRERSPFPGRWAERPGKRHIL